MVAKCCQVSEGTPTAPASLGKATHFHVCVLIHGSTYRCLVPLSSFAGKKAESTIALQLLRLRYREPLKVGDLRLRHAGAVAGHHWSINQMVAFPSQVKNTTKSSLVQSLPPSMFSIFLADTILCPLFIILAGSDFFFEQNESLQPWYKSDL
jgi:hypothetical protein